MMMDSKPKKVVPAEETQGYSKTVIGVTSLWLLLDWAFWLLALAGLSAVQNKCSGASNVLFNPSYFAIPSALPLLQCSRVFRFLWWSLWLQFIVLVLVTVVLATKALAGARAMLVSFLAVSTVLLMISGDKLLNVRDIARGNHINTSAGAAFAGFIVSAAFNFFLMYMVGIET